MDRHTKYFDFVSVCVFVCLSTVNSSILVIRVLTFLSLILCHPNSLFTDLLHISLGHPISLPPRKYKVNTNNQNSVGKLVCRSEILMNVLSKIDMKILLSKGNLLDQNVN